MVDKPISASVLSFCRQIDPTDALLYATTWEGRHQDRQPILIQEKSVRGTASHRVKTKDNAGKDRDPLRIEMELVNPNLQTVDYAVLPHDMDTLVVDYALKVLGNTGVPNACNHPGVQTRLGEMVAEYLANDGLRTLGLRYAANVANARSLWRNSVGAETIEVEVQKMGAGKPVRDWQFDAASMPLDTFRNPSVEVQSLGEDFTRALTVGGHHLYKVRIYARLGSGVGVYPSQLLSTKTEKGDKGKTLFQIGGQAALTSQKIGNALRTIDTWHGASDVGPIAVEPYGAVTSRAQAYRKGKNSFYALFDKWIARESLSLDEKHFVVAILIRGGVFGGSDK